MLYCLYCTTNIWKSTGHSGNYSTNYQLNGRELLTPDEVRLLDNRFAILFIRGEKPIMDYKYDVLKHPNVSLSTDGKGLPYIHGEVTNAVATVNLDFTTITRLENKEDETTSNILEDYEIVSSDDVEKYLKKEGMLWKKY